MLHLVKIIRISRGQKQGLDPFVVNTYGRKREAQGQAKSLRNSYGELLLEKFWEQEYILEYYEYSDYYIFTIEDNIGICHECHIYFVTEIEGNVTFDSRGDKVGTWFSS